jgi:hypothetical protein
MCMSTLYGWFVDIFNHLVLETDEKTQMQNRLIKKRAKQKTFFLFHNNQLETFLLWTSIQYEEVNW